MTRQLLTLAVVLAAGVVGHKLLRIRRTGGFSEIDGRYRAVHDAAGRYMHCEEYETVDGVTSALRIVADEKCGGCRDVWGETEACP